MSEPWLLEDWTSKAQDARGKDALVSVHADADYPAERARLAAAAPALVRALLVVELKGDLGDYGPGCAACGGPSHLSMEAHDASCPVDSALTQAGLDTQEKRDEARRQIAEARR